MFRLDLRGIKIQDLKIKLEWIGSFFFLVFPPFACAECHHECPLANWIRKSVTVQDNLEDDRYFQA